MNKKIDKVNGRLASLRDMLPARPPDQGDAEVTPKETPGPSGPSGSDNTEVQVSEEQAGAGPRRQWN